MIIAKPSKEFINPKTLIASAAEVYSHIAKVNRGMIVYISGQVPSDASGKIIGEGDFEAQVEIARSDETLRLTKHLTRILFVGQKPETVDFSDPTLPPGFNAEKINAGIAIAVAKIGERGWQGSTCMITPDEWTRNAGKGVEGSRL
jgi:Endoribonuclease L-PSP